LQPPAISDHKAPAESAASGESEHARAGLHDTARPAEISGERRVQGFWF